MTHKKTCIQLLVLIEWLHVIMINYNYTLVKWLVHVCRFVDIIFPLHNVFTNTHVIFSWINNDLEVALVGTKVDLTYDYDVSQEIQPKIKIKLENCFWVKTFNLQNTCWMKPFLLSSLNKDLAYSFTKEMGKAKIIKLRKFMAQFLHNFAVKQTWIWSFQSF